VLHHILAIAARKRHSGEGAGEGDIRASEALEESSLEMEKVAACYHWLITDKQWNQQPFAAVRHTYQ
jgi:hypothetical protein